MIYVYIAENCDKETFIKSVLSRHTTAPIEILRNKNGKPYLDKNPVHFNITHSGAYIAAAVSYAPVGIDMEVYGRGIRRAVLSSYNEKEQAEITNEKQFLAHWTAREAYVKYIGGTLADMLKSLEYTGGILYRGGYAAATQPKFCFTDKYVLAVAGDNCDFKTEEIIVK